MPCQCEKGSPKRERSNQPRISSMTFLGTYGVGGLIMSRACSEISFNVRVTDYKDSCWCECFDLRIMFVSECDLRKDSN